MEPIREEPTSVQVHRVGVAWDVARSQHTRRLCDLLHSDPADKSFRKTNRFFLEDGAPAKSNMSLEPMVSAASAGSPDLLRLPANVCRRAEENRPDSGILLRLLLQHLRGPEAFRVDPQVTPPSVLQEL